MKINKFLLPLVAAFIPIAASATIDAIQIFKSNEMVAQIKLAETPRVSGQGNWIKIAAAGNEITFNEPINVKFAEFTGVSTISNSVPSISILNNQIAISALIPGCKIMAYSTNGALVATAIADADGNANIIIPEKGCYIISTPTLSFKIVK